MGHVAMTWPAGRLWGARWLMPLPLFLPLVLEELTEVAASSTPMGPTEPAAGAGAIEEEGPEGAFGDGPPSMVAHGSMAAGAAGPGAPCGEGAAAIAAATLPWAALSR